MSTATRTDGSIGGMIKLGLILAAYAVASCTILALVNNMTAPVIARNNKIKAEQAMRAVIENADDFESPKAVPTTQGSVTIQNVQIAKSQGTVIGAVVQASGPTYDHATIMVGVSKDGVITGLQFLENTDSPGFGSKASDPTFRVKSGTTFYGQFTGKAVADGFVPGQTFDTISGATITSRGVADLLTAAASVAMEVCKEYTND